MLHRDNFDWDEKVAREIWAWSAKDEGANLVADQSTGVQYMLEINEHVASVSQWTTKEGLLCEENLRGTRFNLMDCTLHADFIQCGTGQIMH